MAKLPKKPSLNDIKTGSVDLLDTATKFSPDRFRATVTMGLGLAPTNRFECELPNIDGMVKVNGEVIEDYTNQNDRVMLCTAAQLPGHDITTTPRGIGIEQLSIATGHTTSPVQLTFYLTNTYSMRHYFQEWMECIVSHGKNQAEFLGYHRNYAFGKDVRVRQYSRNGRRVYSVKLLDAYPISMGSVDFNNQSSTAAAEMTVQLAYRTYVPDRETWADGLPDKLKSGIGKVKDKFNF